MSGTRVLLARGVATLLAAISIACGGGGDGGPTAPVVDNTPASITLSSTAPITLTSGATSTITATAFTKDGRALAGSVAFSSSDPTVASVSAGVITALKTGSATIAATAGVASASLVVTVTPGAAAALALRTQPADAAIGVVFGVQPVVEVRDANGNAVAASSAPITVSIASGGGTIGGPITVTSVSGVASFAGLLINGTAGTRTLTFSSPGLASVSSAALVVAPPPVPVIVLDHPGVTLMTARGTSPAPFRVRIVNGGTGKLTGITVDAVAYEPGQPTGWLVAGLDSVTAPSAVTLSASTVALPVGSYRAFVRINGTGATNTPQTITVTLTVLTPNTVTLGTTADRIRIVDVGGVFTPTTTVLDDLGRPFPGVPLTYTSRAPSVATVDAGGRITARSAGDAWIVVASFLSSDSVFVIVPRSASGPLIRTNVTTYGTRVGDTLFVTVLLDPRATTVGGATLGVDIDVASVTFIALTPPGSPAPLINFTSNVYRISIGSATGITGPVPVLTLKIVGRVARTTGFLRLYALDVSGVDASDLTSQTTSTRLPVVIQ